LIGADLTGADLTYAFFVDATLTAADLTNARLNWTSHDLLAEILRQAAGKDVGRLEVAKLVAHRRRWCWEGFLLLNHPQAEWALGVLAGYVQPDDDAPDCVRSRVAV